MKLVRKWILGVAALFLFGGAAFAQTAQEKEAIKKKILDEVEKKLKAEQERLLDEISKIIDEELKKSGAKPSKVDPKEQPKPVPVPAKPKGRGFMGIQPAELTEEELKDLGIESGIRVERVTEAGPAEKAGLKDGDVIVEVDGQKIGDPAALPPVIQKKGAGAVVALKILRDKKEQTIKVTLGRHPQDPPEDNEKPAPKEPDKQPPKDPPKPEQPSATEEELRERIKKFLDKNKQPDKQPVPEPKDDGFFSDDQVQGFRSMLEKLGMTVEQVFEKVADGRWQLVEKYRDTLKGLDPANLKKWFEGKAEAIKPKEAPVKAEPKGAKPWLGIEPEDLTDDVRAQLDLEDGVGLGIAVVKENSPASKAGLQVGDIILKLDGKKLKGEEGLAKFMAAAKAGQAVDVVVLRKSKEVTVKVTLGEKK